MPFKDSPVYEQPEEKCMPMYSYEEVPQPEYYESAPQQQSANIQNVLKENEALKKRLEMSEKMLFRLMHQQQSGGNDVFFPIINWGNEFCPNQGQGQNYSTLE